MFLTAYETTAGKPHVMTKTANEIRRHRAMGGEQLQLVTGEHSDYYVAPFLLTPGIATIPPFGHPLLVTADEKDLNNDEISWSWDGYLVADVRNYMRLDANRKPVINANPDYDLARHRLILQSMWLDKIHFVDLLNVGVFPMKAFTRWVGDNICFRLNVTPDIQMRIQVILAFFYLCLFMPDSLKRRNADEKFSNIELAKNGALITRATGIPANTVIDIIRPLTIMHSVLDLVETLKEHGQSVRFEKFNVEFLTVIIGGSWYGSNKDELLAVALEHPPTWLAILYSAAEERGYKNTFIGKICNQYSRTEELEQFTRYMGKLLI